MFLTANQTEEGSDELLPTDSEQGDGWTGAWPGIAPLVFGDGYPLIGRDVEVDRLERLLLKPKAGQRPMVWLHGDSGVGKTSLVGAGLIPRISDALGESFEWVLHHPARSENVEDLIFSTAEAILTKAVVGGSGPAPLETRMRQFCLLLEQDSVESAAEYLASCFRQAMAVARGREEDTLCLLVLDQLDRLGPEGDVFPGEDSDWGEVNLTPLINFLSELCLTGVFACVAVVRSPNFAIFKKAVEDSGIQGFGSSVRVMLLEVAEVKQFFELMPAPYAESGVVETAPELIELLFETGSKKDGLVPFVSETLRRLTEMDPAAEKLMVEDARWAGGMERSFSFTAENAIQYHGMAGSHETFFQLMSMLYPDDDLAGDYTRKDSAHLNAKEVAYIDIGKRRDLREMVDVLVDARAITLKGDSPQQARFTWALPEGLKEWPRSGTWIERHDRLLDLAKKYDEMRGEWEKEERSQVRLLHASTAIRDARDLLDYHRQRPILTEALIEYLEESLSLHEKLEGVSQVKTHWLKKAGIIAGAALALLLLILLLWKLMA